MKTIFTLLAAGVLSLGANAQITLHEADYAAWLPRTDTFRTLTAAPGNGANASWDLSNALYAPDFFTLSRTRYGRPPFPAADFSYTRTYELSELRYTSEVISEISASGITELGEDLPYQGIDISMHTGTAGDSVIFDPQIVRYDKPRTVLQFPTSPGDRWNSDFSYASNFLLKASMYSAVPFACVRTTYVTQTDTVSGWGRLRIRRSNGAVSAWMDVLAVQSRLRSHDSFYLSGAPAPELMLDFFGLSQAQPDSVFRMSYYRKGEVQALLTVSYADSAFTSPDSAYVHQSRIPAQPTGIGGTSGAGIVRTYPNPVQAGAGFFIELSESVAGRWSYTLTDAAGKAVSEAKFSVQGRKAQVEAPEVAPGLYFLKLHNGGRSVSGGAVRIRN